MAMALLRRSDCSNREPFNLLTLSFACKPTSAVLKSRDIFVACHRFALPQLATDSQHRRSFFHNRLA